MTENTQHTTLLDYFFAAFQLILPHHFLSRIVNKITRIKIRWFKNFLIHQFIKVFHIDMSQAEFKDINGYSNFNHFFTRRLKHNTRPIAAGENTIISPVDGTISEIGNIDNDRLFQAKGHTYTLENLLGGSPERAHFFKNGHFVTIYLSPRDYHRIHMPLTGRLREMIHIPGRLFSVSPSTTRAIPGLFARNERVMSNFSTPAGTMDVILVGAMFVASIDTVWAGTITPPAGNHLRQWSYDAESPVEVKRGDEMGRFNMGSTVILLFSKDRVKWDEHIVAGKKVCMGEQIGKVPGTQN